MLLNFESHSQIFFSNFISFIYQILSTKEPTALRHKASVHRIGRLWCGKPVNGDCSNCGFMPKKENDRRLHGFR